LVVDLRVVLRRVVLRAVARPPRRPIFTGARLTLVFRLAVERRAVDLRAVVLRRVVFRAVVLRRAVDFRAVVLRRVVLRAVERRAVVLFLVVAALRAAVERRAAVLFLVAAALRAAVLRLVEALRVVLFRVVAMGHPLSRVQCGLCNCRRSLGLGVDDNLCNFRMCPPNPLFNLARTCVCICKWTVCIHAERKKRDETDICTKEPYTARLRFDDIVHDVAHGFHRSG
jgi:hypothetical protein